MIRKTSIRTRPTAIVLMLGLVASPGCFWSTELSGVRRDFESQLPGSSFEKNIELSFGPVLLGAAKLVTAVIPGARDARPWLRGVSRVEIGVYDVAVDSMPALQMPRRLQSLVDDGWETAVRIREDNEAVWILYRPDGEKVRDVFIVVLNDHELVMVKARGRLEKLIAAALDEGRGRGGFRRELDG